MADRGFIHQSQLYIPACDPINPRPPILLSDGLGEYIHREFTCLHSPDSHLHVVPSSFSRSGDPAKVQAENAEELVYKRLQGSGLSGVVFHGRVYLKKRDREPIEVKSSADHFIEGVLNLSGGKSIADSRRSAMHQLQTHSKFLHEMFGVDPEATVHCVLWPFLSRYNQAKQERFKKDTNLKHAFADVLQDQESFNAWIRRAMEGVNPLDMPTWTKTLEWFTLLSCGVKLVEAEDLQDSLYVILSQEQLDAISREPLGPDQPLVIDGPAGSGKSLLILLKLAELWKEGLLTPDSQALVLCGRKCAGMELWVKQFISKKGIQHVTIKSLPTSHEPFQAWCEEKREAYKYAFLDAAEDLSWYGNVSKNLRFLKMVVRKSPRAIIWLLTDGNQVVYNLAIEKGPTPGTEVVAAVKLTKIYRTTANIFSFMEMLRLIEDDVRFKKGIPSPQVHLGHSVEGPLVSYLDLVHFVCKEEAVCMLVTDLCGRRGIKPNDIIVAISGGILPFDIQALNKGLHLLFSGQGFSPQGVEEATTFYTARKEENFYVAGSPDYKGLEALVVIAALSTHPCSFSRMVRKRLYTMSSRSRGFLCLLWDVDDESMAAVVKKSDLKEYQLTFPDHTHVRKFFSEVQQEKEHVLNSLKHEEERLKTFPDRFLDVCPVPAKELAEGGFVFYPRSGPDGVQCVFCGGILYDWEPRDTARGEHKKFYSSCPFLKGEDVGNVIRTEKTE
eukprot:m.41518 g.41518  ORF g.41518 m.41518 type:complete len:726 (+) comp33196_c0_seq2:141-2318(+)